MPHQPRGGYALSNEVAALFGQPVVVLNQQALNRSPWYEVRQQATQLINQMGADSAIAQGLLGPGGRPNPITEVHRLGETDARLYILAQQEPGCAPVAVGLLKVGKKNLFHWDANGRTTELQNQMCVLDFFVHEDWRRGGYGQMLFVSMLQNEGVDPARFAYDVSAIPARSPPTRHSTAVHRSLARVCAASSGRRPN